MLRKMGGARQIALILVLILSVFSQQQLFIQDTSEQLNLNQSSHERYFMSGNSTVDEDEIGNNSTDESNSANNETSLNHSLGDDISIDCNMSQKVYDPHMSPPIGFCDITHASHSNYTFRVNTTAIHPTFETNNTSGINVFTYYHSIYTGTERTERITVYSNVNDNISFDADLTFTFTFEDENSTVVNKTTTLQFFDPDIVNLDVDCKSENLDNSTMIYSEINCTFSRMGEPEDETIFIDLQVKPSFKNGNITLNLTGMENKAVQLVAGNSTLEELSENDTIVEIYLEVYMIRNNSTIHLSSFSVDQSMKAIMVDFDLGGVDCSDAAVHLGIMAFACLFEGTSQNEDNQTSITSPERERSNDDEQASLPGFLAINAIMIISMASFIQLYKRKN